MNNNRMQNFGGGTAIAITPIHRDIMNGLLLKGEFDLLKNTTHLDEVFKLAQHPEQTKLAIDTYLNFTQQIESLNCSLTFFGFKQGGWMEDGQMQAGNWKSILSDDKKSFKSHPYCSSCSRYRARPTKPQLLKSNITFRLSSCFWHLQAWSPISGFKSSLTRTNRSRGPKSSK